LAAASMACGSSPRARGTLLQLAVEVGDARVIPACAGNTGSAPRPRPASTGHPRVRGEHVAISINLRSRAGSSPRARGTLLPPTRHQVGDRVIPACAGNTAIRIVVTAMPPGHPRVRGEHLDCLIVDHIHDGSSPRARGTLDELLAFIVEDRVIPACAGNTSRWRGSSDRVPGHPRVRGEHCRSSASASSEDGSSPRARGTRLHDHARHVGHRVIPACAGNTLNSPRSSAGVTGHPRVRGEHTDHLTTHAPGCGSSPRARGTRNRSA